MKPKKYDKVNLEKKKSFFLQIGFVISITAVLLAFEWTHTKPRTEAQIAAPLNFDVEILPVQPQKELAPPPPRPERYQGLNIVEEIGKDQPELEPPDYNAEIDTKIEALEWEQEEEETILFLHSSTQPQFPGGKKALKKHIAQNLRYPQSAARQQVQGRVFVKFLIDETGEVKNVSVLNSISPALDNEALRVIRALPPWKPAMQGKQPVAVWHTIPVVFKLY